MDKSFLWTILIIFLGIISGIALIVIGEFMQTEVNIETEVVKCIANQTTLYTQAGCHYCEQQEEVFGEKYKLLNVVDCVEEKNREKCFKAGISATPTWVINEELFPQIFTIEELQEMTGCGQ